MEKLRLREGDCQGHPGQNPTQGLPLAPVPSPVPILGGRVPILVLFQPSAKGALSSQVSRDMTWELSSKLYLGTSERPNRGPLRDRRSI